MKHPPKLVCSLAYGHNAWIVGSAAKSNLEEEPRDYDVVVSFSEWVGAALLIPTDAKPNTFGGWKCKTPEGIEVDVWPADMNTLLTYAAMKYAWHPKTNTYYEKVDK